MSNTYYCICLDCKVIIPLKDGEEDIFKDEHYGHEILICYFQFDQIVHYDPEEKTVNVFEKVDKAVEEKTDW